MSPKGNLQKKKEVAKPVFNYRPIVIIALSLCVLAGLVIGGVFVFAQHYQNLVPPGTRIGSVAIGGLTYDAAKQKLESPADAAISQELSVSYQGQTYRFPAAGTPETPDQVTSQTYAYDIDQTIKQIASASRRFSELDTVYHAVFGWSAQAVVVVNTEQLKSAMSDQLSPFESPAQNAALVIVADNQLSVTSETAGSAFPYSQVIAAFIKHLQALAPQTISISLQTDTPVVTRASAQGLLPLAQQVLSAAPFSLVYQGKSWPISPEQVHDWIEFQGNAGHATVGLNQKKLTDYLITIAAEINVPMQDAKFAVNNGQVTSFQAAQDGVELQISESVALINQKISQVGINEIDLVVNVSKTDSAANPVNDYGIKELVGEGHSNFKGSPTNRRHNIAVGAAKLNGILIKPDEEFSLVKTLGAIDASTGYLTELVIKGNKTTPEYGGGLCQIGTTTFRAALDAGLPILERTNHSYRVAYYEPAGTDATIYDPRPDLVFKNDTGHYLLLTTEIKGDDLYFRFYGTKDGRTVAQTKPILSNYVNPPAKKIVETTDLAPGKTKCTEKAHVGADAIFTRTITYADGTKKVDTFKSHYKPWQEVCLLGVAKTTAKPAPAPTLPTPAEHI